MIVFIYKKYWFRSRMTNIKVYFEGFLVVFFYKRGYQYYLSHIVFELIFVSNKKLLENWIKYHLNSIFQIKFKFYLFILDKKYLSIIDP